IPGPQAACCRVRPVLRIAGTTSTGVEPGCGDAEVGVRLEVVVVAEQIEPGLEGFEPPAAARRDRELLGERGDVGQLAGCGCVLDGLRKCAAFGSLGRRNAMQGARLLRL